MEQLIQPGNLSDLVSLYISAYVNFLVLFILYLGGSPPNSYLFHCSAKKIIQAYVVQSETSKICIKMHRMGTLEVLIRFSIITHFSY